MSQPLFQYPLVQAPHLEGHFYKHLQKFLASHNLSLEVAGIKTATLPQEYNYCVMDVACIDDDIPDRDIKLIFYCKSFLQVRCVSDFCNTNGIYILLNITNGIRNIQQFLSKFKEIVQEQPQDPIWTVW